VDGVASGHKDGRDLTTKTTNDAKITKNPLLSFVSFEIFVPFVVALL